MAENALVDDGFNKAAMTAFSLPEEKFQPGRGYSTKSDPWVAILREFRN
jgi:hypothetical protein